MAIPTPDSLGIKVVSSTKGSTSKEKRCWELAKASVVGGLKSSLELWGQKDSAIDPDTLKGPNFTPKKIYGDMNYVLSVKCRGRTLPLAKAEGGNSITSYTLAPADVQKQLEAWLSYFEGLNKGADEVAKDMHDISIDVSKPKTNPGSKTYNASTDMYE
jgi:hypothetical protein